MHKENETELEIVRRHIREGAGRVARQHDIMAGLYADGLLTEAAEQLLTTFEDIQRQHIAHLGRLQG